MRDNGWHPVRAVEQPVRNEARQGFQKHSLRFARAEHLERWQLHQVRPELVLLNSHDRSSAYQLHCGLFRLICLNGLVVADATFARIALKHAGFHPDAVIQASFALLEAVPTVMDKVKLFQDRTLTEAERLALVTGAAACRWGSLDWAPVSPAKLLSPRRYGDDKKDLWSTLNSVQENICAGRPAGLFPTGSQCPRAVPSPASTRTCGLTKPSGKKTKTVFLLGGGAG
jgi:hypothetical protein